MMSVEKVSSSGWSVGVYIRDSLLLIDAQSTMGGATLRQISLGCIRREAEHESGSQAVSSTSSWTSHQGLQVLL